MIVFITRVRHWENKKKQKTKIHQVQMEDMDLLVIIVEERMKIHWFERTNEIKKKNTKFEHFGQKRKATKTKLKCILLIFSNRISVVNGKLMGLTKAHSVKEKVRLWHEYGLVWKKKCFFLLFDSHHNLRVSRSSCDTQWTRTWWMYFQC